MCPGHFLLMKEQFDDLMEGLVDEDELDDFFDSIPWCYDQYDKIL